MASKTNFSVNGNNYFRIRRTIGKDANGKPIQKAFYGKSKRQAEQEYEKWKEAQNGKNILRKTSFAEMAKLYAENVLWLSSYATGTKEKYFGVYKNHIVHDKTLGMINITDLTPYDIQAFFNRLNTSYSVKRTCHKFLAAMFNYCTLNGYCNINMSVVTIPKEYSEKEIITWTDNELNIILTNLFIYRKGKYRLRFFIEIAVFTGMRISEIFGLKYSDIS